MAGLDSQSKRKARQRSVDMTIQPDEPDTPDYEPPPDHECDEIPGWPVERTPTERLVGRALEHTGKIVWFALTLQVREETGGIWVDVSRVDCKHSTVHRHQMHRDGQDDTITVLAEIPIGGRDEESWEVVDQQYDAVLKMFETRTDEYIRTWRNS